MSSAEDCNEISFLACFFRSWNLLFALTTPKIKARSIKSFALSPCVVGFTGSVSTVFMIRCSPVETLRGLTVEGGAVTVGIRGKVVPDATVLAAATPCEGDEPLATFCCGFCMDW